MSALVDSGALFSLVRRGDPDAEFFARALDNEPGPLLTTLPCLTEAMYLLGDRAGWPAQEALYDLLAEAAIGVSLEVVDLGRLRYLMTKYSDRPMDFADASLVDLAERTGIDRIITSDHEDFAIYRIGNRQAFRVITPNR